MRVDLETRILNLVRLTARLFVLNKMFVFRYTVWLILYFAIHTLV